MVWNRFQNIFTKWWNKPWQQVKHHLKKILTDFSTNTVRYTNDILLSESFIYHANNLVHNNSADFRRVTSASSVTCGFNGKCSRYSSARNTLQRINISHLGKRKIIFKMQFLGDMLVPWRVVYPNTLPSKLQFINFAPRKMSNFAPSKRKGVNFLTSNVQGVNLAVSFREMDTFSSWWFQSIWKIWVKMGSSSPGKGENKNIFQTTI